MGWKKMVWMMGIVMLCGGVVPGFGWAAELKVGVVDIARAVNECNAGKEAKALIMKEVEKVQRQAQEKQKELQGMKESLDKQAPMLRPEVRTAKEKDYQTKVRDFQRWGEDTQNDINQQRILREKEISMGLQKVIQKIGADEAYTLIVEKNEQIVLFASKAIDITDRVIKTFDSLKK